MLHVKGHHDFGTAHFNQAVLEQVVSSGAFDTQLARIRPAYESKMRVLHGALAEAGLRAAGWTWSEPQGGLYLWLAAPEGTDTSMNSEFCAACIRAGVLYVPGDLCFGDDARRNYVRLSFGVLGGTELLDAGRRFARVASRAGPS
jgi:2-aminoadipate transaminase